MARLLHAGVAIAVLSALCAGLPWALVRFVGWPLPDHLPTIAELGNVLSAPLSTSLLLDVLACGAWLLWAGFLAELAGCLRELVRAAGRPDLGRCNSPLRRVAAVLVTAVVVSFLSRSALAAPAGGGAVQTAQSPSLTAEPPAAGEPTDVELVRPPRDGVHDSLYRIAQRRLGNGSRWPEIWRLNVASAQPGGRTLTSPSLVHPGDRIQLPPTASPAKAQRPISPPPPVSHGRPAPSAPPSLAAPSSAASRSDTWKPEVYVGLGLAGAVSAALLIARRRHRARYRPGSGLRDDDPRIAPVVYQLHLAHQHAQAELDTVAEPAATIASAEAPDEEAGELTLHLARMHGLGLVGPGSYAAARALLLTAMTAPGYADVVVPVAELRTLLGVPETDAELPERVHLVDDLAAALAHLDTLDLPNQAGPILVANSPAGDDERTRLQRLIEEGGGERTVLLLGQWHPGVTAYVDAAGAITATSPGPGEPLRGRHAFSLPESATRDLLTLLHTAHDHHKGTSEEPIEPVNGLEIATCPASERADVTEMKPSAEFQHGAAKPLALSVFGPPTLSWCPDPNQPEDVVEITGRLSRRLWELLIYLALHPDGAPRTAAIDSLGAARPTRDPAAVLRTVLSRLRSTIEAATSADLGDVIVAEHGRYRLEPALIEVDYWAFAGAVARRRTTTDEQTRAAAAGEIVDGYGGELAAGFDTEWLTALREGVRRDALDAVAALARARIQTDPEATLQLLETARDFDPHNELLYRDIMRLEHNLGRPDAVARTLRLLEARLAEIDESATTATIKLAKSLCGLDIGNANSTA
ncbi:transcriptional regulator [Amycolatopsis sp. NPDC098790]|uniref:transcriptional regulator n=1 Tax=Amycolatopsis sp. NPDC098790 TaxID=3363939 RepID=UPI0037FA2C75